jgi:hypothetical protein
VDYLGAARRGVCADCFAALSGSVLI